MAEKWIKVAIKHPGALHRELGVPQGEKIPKAKLSRAAHAGGKLGKRARLAETLSHMHHGGHGSHHTSVNIHFHGSKSGKGKHFKI